MVFCKEVLEETYDTLIEYLDFLFGFENEKEEEISEKKKILSYLWQLTKVL